MAADVQHHLQQLDASSSGASAEARRFVSAQLEDAPAASPGESIKSAAARKDMPSSVRTAMRSLLLSTANVPGTEGRKNALRYDGHANNICFGASSVFFTMNFADTYHYLMALLGDGPGSRSHLDVDSEQHLSHQIAQDEPRMPSLQRMHQIGAAKPRAQAKFFLIQTELSHRFLLGLERLHIGRVALAKPSGPRHDNNASSLQPSLALGLADLQSPIESQGRGFAHGHAKGHGIVGPTLRWLRKALGSAGPLGLGLVSAVRILREALLAAASSVQYEAVNEPGRQLGVPDMPSEPFTEKQRRQSRMDGGAEGDDDHNLREDVPVAPALVQPHIQRARDSRGHMPCVGADAYRNLSLTGAFQSVFPW